MTDSPIPLKRRPGRPRLPVDGGRRVACQTRIREPLKLRLEAAAHANCRSLSEEIEIRLEHSFWMQILIEQFR